MSYHLEKTYIPVSYLNRTITPWKPPARWMSDLSSVPASKVLLVIHWSWITDGMPSTRRPFGHASEERTPVDVVYDVNLNTSTEAPTLRERILARNKHWYFFLADRLLMIPYVKGGLF